MSTIERFKSGDWDQLEWWEIIPLAPLWIARLAVSESRKDRVTTLTASLAFTTALSIVPLLSVAISLLAAFGLFDTTNSSLTPYIQQLFPAFASEIATYLQEFAQTSAREIAGIGTVVLIVIGIFLFHSIERAFNNIWNASKDRPWAKIFAFYTLITIGPVLISLSFILSARAQIRLAHFGIDTGILDRFLPFVLALALFTAMNRFLPHTKVSWPAAFFGGAFTAISFEVAKWGFNVYVTEIILESYNKVYGALGLFPLFLIWLYVVWIIVLFGAELAYCFQNLQTLLSVKSAQRRRPEKHKEYIFDPLVGLELFAPIARAFKSGQGAVTEKELVARSGYSGSVVRNVVRTLERIGALVSVEEGDTADRKLMPSKQLDDIELLPVVTSFFDLESPATSIPMAELRRGYKAVTMEALRAESALALIPEDSELWEQYSVPPWKPLPTSSLAETSSWAEEAPPSQVERPAADAELEPPPEVSEPLAEAVQPAEPRREEPHYESTTPVEYGARRDDLAAASAGGISGVGAETETPAPRSGGRASPEAAVEAEGAVTETTRPDAAVPEELEEVSEVDADGVPFLDIDPDASSSMEIELGTDWDDFEISEVYDEVDSSDLRQTAEVDMEEAELGELGDEPSVPPPTPDKS